MPLGRARSRPLSDTLALASAPVIVSLSLSLVPFPQFSWGLGAVPISQGQGADAACSTRIHHHLKQRATRRAAGLQPPDHLIIIVDNCVGQNKSVACFQIFMLVVCGFYKSVTLTSMISARQLRHQGVRGPRH